MLLIYFASLCSPQFDAFGWPVCMVSPPPVADPPFRGPVVRCDWKWKDDLQPSLFVFFPLGWRRISPTSCWKWFFPIALSLGIVPSFIKARQFLFQAEPLFKPILFLFFWSLVLNSSLQPASQDTFHLPTGREAFLVFMLRLVSNKICGLKPLVCCIWNVPTFKTASHGTSHRPFGVYGHTCKQEKLMVPTCMSRTLPEMSHLLPKARHAALHLTGGTYPGVPGFTCFCIFCIYAWTHET